jgi:uncharacterized membrane protein HdeD (DUF308 family)
VRRDRSPVALIYPVRQVQIVTQQKGSKTLIVLGIVLLIIGFIAKIAIIWTIGIILVVVGAVLAVAGFAGREIGGRKHWY